MANYTILLIDYEPRSIERFRQPLTEAGYAVEVATDGLTGIAAFHRLSPDMVLVEAMIPKKHGFEVCQELKRTPHGRKTPVLITTGVYKGRKYRTQALHIYGCDEYIEKPIAPEQLLAVVGKFFGPAAVATAAPASESRTVAPVEPATVAVSDGATRAGAAASGSPEPAPSRPAPAKPTPSSVAKDFTEEEIMARLDAILPSGEPAQPPEPLSAPIAAVAEPDWIPASVTIGTAEADESQDPFSQMQAELTAELGSMAAALALEPAPVFETVTDSIPSDQVVSPSVLEALPAPDSEMPQIRSVREEDPVELERVAEAPANDPPGQLVNFDAKRSRRKKGGKKTPPSTAVSVAPQVPNAAPPVAPPAAASQASFTAKRAVEPLTLPAGTLAESDLAGTPGKQRVSIWMWVALIVIALVAAYLVVFRDRATPSVTTAAEPSSADHETAGPVVTEPEVAQSAAAETGNASLVLNSVDPPARRSPTPAPAPVSSSGSPVVSNKTAPVERPQPSKLPAATAPSSPVSAPAKAATPKKQPFTVLDAPFPAQVEEDKTKLAAPTTAPAPIVEEAVSGVESIADPSGQRVVPSIALGTLVSADELDTPPVSLSRKLPTYSLQARQMRAEGTVVMKVLVNERGTVDEVVLVTGAPGADLNASAMRAAKSWTYRPATKGGVAVKVWKIEQVAFKL